MICKKDKRVYWDVSYGAYLIELDDVGMSDFFENFNFSRDSFNVFLVVDLFLLKNFDCHLSKMSTYNSAIKFHGRK